MNTTRPTKQLKVAIKILAAKLKLSVVSPTIKTMISTIPRTVRPTKSA